MASETYSDCLKNLETLYGQHLWQGMKDVKNTPNLIAGNVSYSENPVNQALYNLGVRVGRAILAGEI
jgi:hypothetical protein